jgi:hypothetical protein
VGVTGDGNVNVARSVRYVRAILKTTQHGAAFRKTVGPVEKHQFLLAASFANPEELNESALAIWTFSTGPVDS